MADDDGSSKTPVLNLKVLLMNKLAKQLNRALGPAVDFLSAEGKRMYFPYGGILGQGSEAKGCAINATIGMAFEEDGSPLVMDCFSKNVPLGRKATNSSFVPAKSSAAMRNPWVSAFVTTGFE